MSGTCAMPGCGHAKKAHWRQLDDIRGCSVDGCACSRYITQSEIDEAIADATNHAARIVRGGTP